MSDLDTIGICCTYMVEEKGGHERYVKRLIRALVDKGTEVYGFANQFDQDFREHPMIHCIPVGRIKIEGWLRHWTFNRNCKRKVEQFRDRLDLVFTTGNMNFGDVYRAGGGVHRVHMRKVNGWPAYLKPKNWAKLHLQRQLFSSSEVQHFITNSKMVKREIQDEYGVSEERIKVVYNGVDTERFDAKKIQKYREPWRSKLGLNEEHFVGVFAGTHWERKGLPELLEGFSLLDSPNYRLLIAGDVKTKRAKQKCRELGISDQVMLLGYVEHLEKVFAAGDYFIFPSRYDAGANVVLEALASGLPVITTDSTGTSEAVFEGENGYVIKPRKPFSIQEKVELLSDSKKIEIMGKNAYENGQKYTMKRNFEGIFSSLQTSSF